MTNPSLSHDQHVHPDVIRRNFSAALSAMYRKEVPLYGDLVTLVDEINNDVRKHGGSWETSERLAVERHGAIRLGKADELRFIARFFSLMGMHPVGYYDLSTAGVPVHSTAFRPTSQSALDANPFRVFTSLLRPDLISDPKLQREAEGILETRDIFHPTVRKLVVQAEKEGGLSAKDADDLVQFGLETFRWHDTARVDAETYHRLHAANPLVADIVGFQGPHINHLTPRVLDIDRAQEGMALRNIPPKQIIEGPPKRECPILLRQTSFRALSEAIRFIGGGTAGAHRARFGEIESRGVAVTPKGHELYLRLLQVHNSACEKMEDNSKHQASLATVFQDYPDSWSALRKEKLAYFRYTLTFPAVSPKTSKSLEDLIQDGIVTVVPIVYEDFLPASAAGIFQSNLAGESGETSEEPAVAGEGKSSQETFEEALGSRVIDQFELYERIQQDSIDEVVRLTGCRV